MTIGIIAFALVYGLPLIGCVMALRILLARFIRDAKLLIRIARQRPPRAA